MHSTVSGESHPFGARQIITVALKPYSLITNNSLSIVKWPPVLTRKCQYSIRVVLINSPSVPSATFTPKCYWIRRKFKLIFYLVIIDVDSRNLSRTTRCNEKSIAIARKLKNKEFSMEKLYSTNYKTYITDWKTFQTKLIFIQCADKFCRVFSKPPKSLTKRQIRISIHRNCEKRHDWSYK